MKTKIGIPIGLALVMFLGVFTAMLAFGTLSPQPAEAQNGPSATRSFDPDPVMPGEQLMVTITVANVPSNAIGAITETLPSGFAYVAGSASPAPFSETATGQEVRFLFSGPPSTLTYTVTASSTVGSHEFSGQLNVDGTNYTIAANSAMVSTTPPTPVMMVKYPMATNTNTGPGEASGYRFQFTTPDMLTGQDTISLHFDKDFRDLPAVLSRGNVTVSASAGSGSATTFSTGPSTTGAYSPASDATREILTSGKHGLSNSAALNNVEYTFYVPDMNGDVEGAPGIAAGAMVTVLVSPGAGIRNPTEGSTVVIKDDGSRSGGKGPIGVFTSKQSVMDTTLKITVDRTLQLSDYDTNRGKSITVIGKGFQNGTTAHILLSNSDVTDEELLAVTVDSDDTFSATIQVTVPPFVPGKGNMIRVEDGNQPPFTAGPVGFEVEGLLTVSPASAAVGDEVDLTLRDWPNDGPIPAVRYEDGNLVYSPVTIADVPQRIIGSPSVSGGSATFRIEINTATPGGTNEIKIDTPALRENDTVRITVSGAELQASPTMAVPNQAITVTGRGFTGGATINYPGDGSMVSIGQNMAALDETVGGFSNFNNGQGVIVDSGGSWSATIIVPITSSTATPGEHPLTVKGSGDREGSVNITIPPRTLTIEPAEARPGENVTLTGKGFPATNSRNKEQNTPSIQIYYDNVLVGTSVPDADGNILLSFRVPLDAAIPSTNRVEARYRIPGAPSGAAPVKANANHEVPGARINLSMDEGKPGDSLTITGDGFKAFASVGYVEIGGIEITPAPKPATDRNGEFTATILVPDLASGTNAIIVGVSGVTASANFKVLDISATTVTTMMAEDATPADAFADLIAEDNLVRVYHFNKHEQTDPDTGGWSLYDTREAFMSLNSIEMIEAGEFYWLMVNNEQLNVMLGSERVDLVAGWNQIRW